MTLRVGLKYQQSIGAHDLKYLSNKSAISQPNYFTHLNGLIVLQKSFPCRFLEPSYLRLILPRNSIEKQASPFLHRHQQRNSHVTSVVNVTIFKLVYGNARAKSCNVNVQFLFLARIVAVTASNHFCQLSPPSLSTRALHLPDAQE